MFSARLIEVKELRVGAGLRDGPILLLAELRREKTGCLMPAKLRWGGGGGLKLALS